MKKILLLAAATLMLSGCINVHVGKMTKHDLDATEPRMFVKEGLSHDQMVLDSVDCQDEATARATTNENYTSSVGFTPEQVKAYEDCMIGKGYKEAE